MHILMILYNLYKKYANILQLNVANISLSLNQFEPITGALTLRKLNEAGDPKKLGMVK